MRVLMEPSTRTYGTGEGGIRRVIEAYERYMPEFDIQFVDDKPDLVVSHAGARVDSDVCIAHGLYWTADLPSQGWEWRVNAQVIESMRNAARITVPSQWVAETLRRDMRVDPDVIGHGIEMALWNPTKEPGSYVLWNKNRQSDVCSPAVAMDLARRCPAVPFISTFGESLPNVRLTGVLPHSEMRDLVREAAVYLSTPKETFGIGILEAMAAEVPVLAVGWGGANDLVIHQVTGYLARPGDIEDLEAGLDYCLRNRKALGMAGRKRAETYDWRQVGQRMAAVFHAALAQRREPTTVGIVVPCYNYAHLLPRALKSIAAQTRQADQVVVVDDGSADPGAAARVVRDFQSQVPGLTILSQNNAGVAVARNNGIAACRTKYVVCLDSDDAIDPDFVATCLTALENDKTLSLAYTGILTVERDGHTWPADWPWEYDYDNQTRGQNQVPTCCMFRRLMWQRLGGYRQRYAPRGAGSEDAEFWLRGGAYGFKARKVSKKPLFQYSFGTGIVSGSSLPEVSWRGWHPWTRDGRHPFASLAKPAGDKLSHPVRQYDTPRVSVVIPVGPGHSQYLLDALDSLEAQTFRNWEAVVVNDTGAPFDLPAYPYVRMSQTTGRIGAALARNLGVEQARADLVVFLDADDYLLPDCIQSFVNAYEATDRWIYSDCLMIEPGKAAETFPAAEFDPESLLDLGVSGVTGLYRKCDLQTVGGFDPTANREEWDLHLRLAAVGLCGQRIGRPLWAYRLQTGKRRIAPGRDAAAERVRRQYSKESLQMACGSCARKRTVPNEAVTNLGTNNNVVFIEYIGSNRSDVSYHGSGGGIYRFGNNDHNRVLPVRVEDAPNFMGKSVFRVAESPAIPLPGSEVRSAVA